MGKYIMALDQGTTSSRCILFDKQGNICSISQKEYNQIYPQPGWVEHNPLQIWSSQFSVAVEAMAMIDVTASDISAIGITNQRETTIIWDKKTGKPVYNAIVWQCRRTADIIEQLKKDAKLVDTDTIMMYIRVLSELANDLKVATQKRIKLEVTLIKLMKPAMSATQDISDIMGRLSVLEGQMQDALNKLKNGVIPANINSVAGEIPFNNTSIKKESVEKRVIEALPEDMEAIAKQWDSIVYSIDDPMARTFLLQSNVTLTQDGTALEIMFKSTSAYNAFSREEDRQRLEELIEERTGISVNIKITKLDDNEDFQNRFTDIRELVSNIDIVVDDKEEYI